MNELKLALNKKKKDTAPGHDQVTYSMVKNLPEEALKILLQCYNDIWDSKSKLPSRWKKINIIPILKTDKDPAQAESYRPISLIPVLLKIMNTMIKMRLEWFVEKQKIIPTTQYGFRKSRGCADYLLHLILDMETARTLNETVILTSLDITSAYDNIHLPRLF